MSYVIFQRTYRLGEKYEAIKKCASEILGDYLENSCLFEFNDLERTVTFSSERLVPGFTSGRPRVMLLFSNPHPHSVRQGMYLSPNTKGRENDFWSVMEAAG
jgi:hypothetical protein